MQADSDEQLIARVAAGDSHCLGTLFERHHRSVFQYCRQVTRHSAQAEDLVQEVFLKILDKADSYRQQGCFKAWLFNIARNSTLDYLRQAKRRATQDIEEAATGDLLVDHRSAETGAAATEDVHNLALALGNLPLDVQEVIWLGRFEFDNYADLGQALGCKAATARVRMHRAMQQLTIAFESINGAPTDVR